MPEATVVQMPIKTKLVCSDCGAPGEGSCRCGASYIPWKEKAAVDAVTKDPNKSNRAIADDLGVDEKTVRKARKKSTADQSAVRTGKDGKSRKPPKPKPAPPLKTKDTKGRVAGVDITVEPPVWQAFNELAQQEGKSASALINELIDNEIDGTDLRVELPKTAQEKLDAAIRQHQRKIDSEHAQRMRGLDEEVRLRVLKEGKEYLEMVKEKENKAWETEKLYRDLTNNRKPIFSKDEYDLLRKCLHQKGLAIKDPKDFDAAFDLIQKKKLQLTGQK